MEWGKNSIKPNGYILPDNLRGRSIHTKVIPTVCNLENMLKNFYKSMGILLSSNSGRKEVIKHTGLKR